MSAATDKPTPTIPGAENLPHERETALHRVRSPRPRALVVEPCPSLHAPARLLSPAGPGLPRRQGPPLDHRLVRPGPPLHRVARRPRRGPLARHPRPPRAPPAPPPARPGRPVRQRHPRLPREEGPPRQDGDGRARQPGSQARRRRVRPRPGLQERLPAGVSWALLHSAGVHSQRARRSTALAW